MTMDSWQPLRQSGARPHVWLAQQHHLTGDVVCGRGWLALTVTGFATWQPLRVLLGLAVWGLVRALAFYLELQHGWHLPPELLTSLPYIAIVLVLLLISRDGAWVKKSMPQSIGKTL